MRRAVRVQSVSESSERRLVSVRRSWPLELVVAGSPCAASSWSQRYPASLLHQIRPIPLYRVEALTNSAARPGTKDTLKFYCGPLLSSADRPGPARRIRSPCARPRLCAARNPGRPPKRYSPPAYLPANPPTRPRPRPGFFFFCSLPRCPPPTHTTRRRGARRRTGGRGARRPRPRPGRCRSVT